MDPFVSCVFGPMCAPSMGVGAPDGSTNQSILIEHRQCVTIAPSANFAINFAIVPSPYGGVGIDEGTFIATYNAINNATPNVYSAPVTQQIVATSQTPGTGASQHYGLIPFQEYVAPAGHAVSMNNFAGVDQFRVLSTKARIFYVGDAFHNSGVLTGSKQYMSIDHESPANVSATGLADEPVWKYSSTGSRLPTYPPKGQGALCGIAGSRMTSVTEPQYVYEAPWNLEYQNVKESWIPFTTDETTETNKDFWFGGYLKVDATGPPVVNKTVQYDPIPGIGYCPITFLSVTGMQADQSIVVELVSCVEYTLGYTSPYSRLAMLPPAHRPMAIEHVKELARHLPSTFPATPVSDQHGYLGMLRSAWNWYWPKERAIATASIRTGLGIANAFSRGGVNAVTNGFGRLALTGSNRLMLRN